MGLLEICSLMRLRCDVCLICYKIIDLYLYLNSVEKMRNYLVEEMLNEDFLYLMECFQVSLYDGIYFNFLIQLLK